MTQRLRQLAVSCVAVALFVTGCGEAQRDVPTVPTSGIEPALAKAPSASAATASQAGVWGAPFSWGGPSRAIGIHLHLLPNGKVLTWGHSGQPSVWDPTLPTQFATLPSPALLFCSGHAFLADGRLLITGGHDDNLGDEVGVKTQHTFNYATQAWTVESDLAYGRWYPTSTTLPNGDVFTVGGTDSARRQLPIPEIWSNGVSRPLPGATWDFSEATASYYPRMFVAPNGKMFYAGEEQQTRWIDVTGAGSVTAVPRSNFGRRDYGSSVSYDAGKILILGGGYTPTDTAEVIDLNQSNPPRGATSRRWHTHAAS